MNLAVDIGNTVIKAAVFDNGQVLETFKSDSVDIPLFETIFEQYPTIERAILASSRKDIELVERVSSYIKERVGAFTLFGPTVPVPIKNLYGTPETLGPDRLAAAVGAAAIYPGSNILLVDFGTAITIDVVSKHGEFLGGNISPGASIRFRGLHDYTGKLPLQNLTESVSLLGHSSREAIEGGVINGIVYEVEGYIARLESEYDELRIVFTGGDSDFFAKRLKNTIFATYDLVVYGLNRILEYNAD